MPAAPSIAGRPAARRAEHFRLTGPSIRLDPRIYAVRKDIADIELADRVFAPHYAAAEHCRVIAPATPLREAPSDKARAVSQLLLGEGFAVIDNAGGWAWGYGMHDRYVGYVSAAALGEAPAPDHVVHAASALLFAEEDIKSAVLATLPMGSRFAATGDGPFLKVEGGGYVHVRHARPISATEDDPVAIAERLLGQPYRWGGRGGDGTDCSGLVQMALSLCGIDAPRDTDQQREIGTEVPDGEPARRGDLIFFPGHVGLMADGEQLLHANAHWMAVVREPLADVVARLKPNHDQPILARRRVLP